MIFNKRSVIIFCLIAIVVVILFLIINSKQAIKDINMVELIYMGEMKELSSEDTIEINDILTNGRLGTDAGLSCGLNEDIKIKAISETEEIILIYPFDGCGNLKIENRNSSYIFIDKSSKKKLDEIVINYVGAIH